MESQASMSSWDPKLPLLSVQQPPSTPMPPQMPPPTTTITVVPSGPLFADDESNRRFQITDKDFQKEIAQVEYDVRATTQNNMNNMQECLTSAELLQGLLFPNETEIDIPPLFLAHVYCNGWKENDRYIYNAVAKLTTTRLLLMKVSQAQRSTLTQEQVKTFLVADQLNVSHKIYDGNFFYPIPLRNIRGLAFRTSYESSTNQSVQKKRYGAFLVMIALVLMSFFITLGVTLSEDNATTLGIVGGILFLAMLVLSVIYCCMFRYPRMPLFSFSSQIKMIELGFVDPLSQQNVVANLVLSNSYSVRDAKQFLSIMQLQAPHLSGV